MKRRIDSLEQFDELAREIEALPHETDRIDRFCECVLSATAVPRELVEGDPFSDRYFEDCRAFLVRLTGTDGYSPDRNERSDFLDGFESGTYVPSVYRYNDSRVLGDSFGAAGAILQALDVRAGASVLEYGAGDGQIALALARMGCDVSVIDIDERYLRIIDHQAQKMGVRIHTAKGLFGDGVPGNQFDRVLFYEAFHHSLEHGLTLVRLHDVLKPDGRLLLAGEPIIPPGDYWRDVVPMPWGPRLDGLSLRAIRNYGWCELGFQREYLIERMMRAGWMVRFVKCAATDRGNLYVAERAGDTIELGKSYVVESAAGDDGWFEGEGEARWTRGTATLGLNQPRKASGVAVRLHNYLPVAKTVNLVAGRSSASMVVPPGGACTGLLSLPPDYQRLQIVCVPTRVADVVPGSTDERQVGIAVSTVQYAA